jgi:predicted outer membrane repeat protein
VSGNTSAYEGGGISITGALTVTNSTVSGNSVRNGNGGGIYLAGTLTVTNSTVSGNTAGHSGGGVYGYGGTLTLTNSTVSGNSAEFRAGAVYNRDSQVTLTRSLIDGDCGYSAIISGGYNIESPGDTCRLDPDGTDLVDVPDPMLGPRQDNGGPTETHALLPGSVAIDAIPGDACEVETDQRGQPRPETDGSMCDVGAFEVQP